MSNNQANKIKRNHITSKNLNRRINLMKTNLRISVNNKKKFIKNQNKKNIRSNNNNNKKVSMLLDQKEILNNIKLLNLLFK